METIIPDNIKDETKKETVKEKPFFIQQPTWIIVFMIGLGLLMAFIKIAPELQYNLMSLLVSASGFQSTTIALITSALVIPGFLYFFLVQFYTRNITNKLILCKIMGWDVQFHLSKRGFYELIIPKTTEHTYEKKKSGVYEIDFEAVHPLENGVRCMPTVYEYDRGVDFRKIKDNTVFYGNPNTVEDRIMSVKMQEAEKTKRGILDPAVLMPLVMIIMVIGIAGYLIIGQVQQGSCQAELVKCSNTMLDHGIKAATEPTALEKVVPGMNTMK